MAALCDQSDHSKLGKESPDNKSTKTFTEWVQNSDLVSIFKSRSCKNSGHNYDKFIHIKSKSLTNNKKPKHQQQQEWKYRTNPNRYDSELFRQETNRLKLGNWTKSTSNREATANIGDEIPVKNSTEVETPLLIQKIPVLNTTLQRKHFAQFPIVSAINTDQSTTTHHLQELTSHVDFTSLKSQWESLTLAAEQAKKTQLNSSLPLGLKPKLNTFDYSRKQVDNPKCSCSDPNFQAVSEQFYIDFKAILEGLVAAATSEILLNHSNTVSIPEEEARTANDTTGTTTWLSRFLSLIFEKSSNVPVPRSNDVVEVEPTFNSQDEKLAERINCGKVNLHFAGLVTASFLSKGWYFRKSSSGRLGFKEPSSGKHFCRTCLVKMLKIQNKEHMLLLDKK